MNDMRKAMVIGAGDIGRRVFHELAGSARPRQLCLVGRDEEVTLRAANMARFCAVQRGYAPDVSYAVTDLSDVSRTAEVIADAAPDVIFLAASFQSWWVITTLPKQAFESLYAANYGPWLPMHLVPVRKAMEAVRLAGSDAVVVNAAYPDAVHPVLTAVGLAPMVGIGNVANNVPGIRAAAADELAVDVAEVRVRLVAHHYVSHRLSRHGDSGPAEMALEITHRGRDVTARLEAAALLKRLPAQYRRTGGLAGQVMTAASALTVLGPLLDGTDALVHAPGPIGMIGGYPVRIEAGQVHLDLPAGLSEQDAVAVNVSGQRGDGIAEIRADGTVVFEDSAMAVLARELGYDCTEMRLSEADDCAEEIASRFAKYRARLGERV